MLVFARVLTTMGCLHAVFPVPGISGISIWVWLSKEIRNSVIMFARCCNCNSHLLLSVILFVQLIIRTSRVISPLKTIQIIVSTVHFQFTALFAHNFYTDIYMMVEYRIFVQNYVRHNRVGKRTLIYKKYLFEQAFVSNELLTLMIWSGKHDSLATKQNTRDSKGSLRPVRR